MFTPRNNQMNKAAAMFLAMSCVADVSAQPTHEHDRGSRATSGYADVNGLRMYYELHGAGEPLVLLHGGGSTITTTFGAILPDLARHHRVIAVELQAHGHTADRGTPLSFEQDADDVAELLRVLEVDSADVFGFSNGGTTAMYLAIRHPEKVRRLVLASALCKRDGVPQQFWTFMAQATPESMPQAYKDAYRAVAPDPGQLDAMGTKCAQRMIHFADVPDADLRSIQAPALIVIGDRDVMTPEHAVFMHRMLPNSRLAIIPGGHGDYIGEITTHRPDGSYDAFALPLIERFLEH
jgi:pimeloyl-ACP methyl ester carboxylesterase